MTAVQTELTAILKRAAKRLRGVGLPAELAERMEELAKQVHQPCVVAENSLENKEFLKASCSRAAISRARPW